MLVSCCGPLLDLELNLGREDANNYHDWLGGTTRGEGVGATTGDDVAAASKLLGRPRSSNTLKAVKALQESILARIQKDRFKEAPTYLKMQCGCRWPSI